MKFHVGMKVRIQQRVPGGEDHVYGHGTVAKVGFHMITLGDGSKWRVDGYAWGSKPTRGTGRWFERQIVSATADQFGRESTPAR